MRRTIRATALIFGVTLATVPLLCACNDSASDTPHDASSTQDAGDGRDVTESQRLLEQYLVATQYTVFFDCLCSSDSEFHAPPSLHARCAADAGLPDSWQRDPLHVPLVRNSQVSCLERDTGDFFDNLWLLVFAQSEQLWIENLRPVRNCVSEQFEQQDLCSRCATENGFDWDYEQGTRLSPLAAIIDRLYSCAFIRRPSGDP